MLLHILLTVLSLYEAIDLLQYIMLFENVFKSQCDFSAQDDFSAFQLTFETIIGTNV